MAKLLNLMLLVFAVQTSLILFAGQSIPGGALWDFLNNPTAWNASLLISLFSDTMLVAGLGLIVVGTFFYKSDFVTFSGITVTFMSFGTSLYNLWQYLDSEGVLGGAGTGNSWISILFVSPVILMYLYVILEFWRGKD